MLQREPLEATLANRVRHLARSTAGDAVAWAWRRAEDVGAIGPKCRRGRQFGSFGEGSIVCFPSEVVNPHHIHLGAHTVIAPYTALSAGWGPGHQGLPEVVVRIGDRSLIGRGGSVIGHELIDIGDDVWTGRGVHITDMNHGFEDVDRPISVQHQAPDPIVIGDGAWLGHNTVVLPGARIGRHTVVGAGSVVVGELPEFAVCVGSPARVVRRYEPGEGWIRVGPQAATELAARGGLR